MKAISLWQPWGSLWVNGDKVNETRGWYTSYRGWLYVHAAKRFQSEEIELCHEEPFKSCLAKYYKTCRHIPLGCILGEVNLCDCVPVERIRDTLSDQERAFGNYADGRFAWKTDARKAYKLLVPYRGRQGFFDVGDLTPLQAPHDGQLQLPNLQEPTEEKET